MKICVSVFTLHVWYWIINQSRWMYLYTPVNNSSSISNICDDVISCIVVVVQCEIPPHKDTVYQTRLSLAHNVHNNICKWITSSDSMRFQSDPCDLCFAVRWWRRGKTWKVSRISASVLERGTGPGASSHWQQISAPRRQSRRCKINFDVRFHTEQPLDISSLHQMAP